LFRVTRIILLSRKGDKTEGGKSLLITNDLSTTWYYKVSVIPKSFRKKLKC